MKQVLLEAVLLAVVAGAVAGCGDPGTVREERSAVASEGRLGVFVSVLPQVYFVKRIGGGRVEVEALVAPGESPATYQVTPQQMARLAHARLYFRVGVPFEHSLMPKVEGMAGGVKVVDTRRGIQLREMVGRHHEAEQTQGHQDETALDPHIWLSPPLVAVQAKAIAGALSEVDPAHAAEYAANLEAFLSDLEATHAHVAEILAPYKGRSFYVFHPAFGYFAEAFGLEQVAAETEGKSPTPKQIERLIRQARADHVRVIFVQPQLDARSAQALASAIGGAVVPMDPLAEDVLANLEDMAAKVAEALKQ